MHSVGLIEIFFGQPWPQPARLAYASFLRENGFGFYLYGPKADARLRKHWMQTWPVTYLQELRTLSIEYRKLGLKFGVVLSPYGLHQEINRNSASQLNEKIQLLSEIGIDMLGIFFDDMPNADGLARRVPMWSATTTRSRSELSWITPLCIDPMRNTSSGFRIFTTCFKIASIFT